MNFEKPQNEEYEKLSPDEVLNKGLKEHQERINELLKEQYGLNGNFLDGKGRLQIGTFGINEVYTKEELGRDREKIKLAEKKFAQNETSKTKIEIKTDKSNAPEKLEKVMTLILQKVLGERFIVMRSSVYDDYFNKTDHIIIDQETGEVVCAFDELNDYRGFELKRDSQVIETEGKRAQEKMRSVLEKARKGGTTIKYGLKPDLENQTMQMGEINNLPLFFLPVEAELLNRLIFEVTENNGVNEENLSENEMEVIKQITESVSMQITRIESDHSINNKKFKESLERFKGILDIMREAIEKENVG